MDIYIFARKHMLKIEINCRYNEKPGTKNRFYAKFLNTPLIQPSGHSLYNFGNGRTRRDAIESYIKEIKGKTLYGNPSRCRRIDVPENLYLNDSTFRRK